jgi:putative transposase
LVKYRRTRIAGGTYFLTATLNNRRSTLLTDHINVLKACLRETIRRRPFRIEAMVVLPDHWHAIWCLPPGDDNYSGRMRCLKSRFVRELRKAGVQGVHDRNGECTIWQRRFWEHVILDEGDLERHADYIHFNPVKHGLVLDARDWPHSSLHRWIRMGRLPEGWGSADPE